MSTTPQPSERQFPPFHVVGLTWISPDPVVVIYPTFTYKDPHGSPCGWWLKSTFMLVLFIVGTSAPCNRVSGLFVPCGTGSWGSKRKTMYGEGTGVGNLSMVESFLGPPSCLLNLKILWLVNEDLSNLKWIHLINLISWSHSKFV